MKEQYEEVKAEELNPGDVVHVSFHSTTKQNLCLNKKVIEVRDTHVKAQGNYYFYKEYCRYYLVEKAKKPLPTAIGSVIKHPDGWQFIRLGEDNWKGLEPGYVISPFKWTDDEVESDDWEQVA